MADERVSRIGLPQLVVAWMVCAAVLFYVYDPALRGAFVSDDFDYLGGNPWVQRFASEDLFAILDPRGDPARYIANYAPVTYLLHALEWWVFGEHPLGYHVVNLTLHAGVTVLLGLLLVRAGMPHLAAALGAALFLVHPANVETVAWISQLKTLASTGLAMCALLAHPRRPAAGAAFFVLGVLTKATAAFALPVAAYAAWSRRRAGDPTPQAWRWLGGWTVFLAVWAVPQALAFAEGDQGADLHDLGPALRLRTMFAIGARYLWMAATGLGVGPFQQPPPATALLDPWWLAGLAAGALLLARVAVTLRRSAPEGGFWLWAACAYAPVSQFSSFIFPIADRYLYAVLPGLIGGGLFVGAEVAARRGARRPPVASTLRGVALAAAVCVLAAFAMASHRQAAVWRDGVTLSQEAVRVSPDGVHAWLLVARRAGAAGDTAGAVAALRAAADRGFNAFDGLPAEPAFGSIRSDPEFRAFVSELAGRWIETARAHDYQGQMELQLWTHAHLVRGEHREALEMLERAAARGGPLQADVQAELAQLRAELARDTSEEARP